MAANGASLCYPSYLSLITTFIGMNTLFLFAKIQQFFLSLWGKSILTPERGEGYGQLFHPMKTFFQHNLYSRVQDMCNRPIASRPDRVIELLMRDKGSLCLDGVPWTTITKPIKKRKNLNFGSYNYLGFSKPPQHVENKVLKSLERFGVSSGGSRRYAYNSIVRELEESIAEFVGKEAALIMGMGYSTNSMILSTLIGEGDLILADRLSHSSTLLGMRKSKAVRAYYDHNNAKDLEKKIRHHIAYGQPRSKEGNIIPYKRIWVLFEGIYSMEGEFPPLRQYVDLRKKYGVCLFMDEAHSMGGTGKTGRGACEVLGVSPNDVDVLMGTFTKAFGSVGGYIAADQKIVDYLKQNSTGTIYGTVIPPVCAEQALQCKKMMDGKEGILAIQRQRENALRLYRKLRDIGVEVMGTEGSPVLCIMLYNLTKLIAFSRLTFKQGLAICTVGYPATSMYSNRARLCVSAQHTEQDIDNCVEIISHIADQVLIKYNLPWYKRVLNLLL